MAQALPLPPDQIVAVRELRVEGEDARVLVTIGLPTQVTPHEAVCPLRYTYKGETSGRQMHGIDRVQALALALNTIPVDLRHSARLPVGRMYRHKPGDDMGFPQKDGWQ